MERENDPIPINVVENWNRKYLAQPDVELRSLLLAEMLYTLFLYSNGRLSKKQLEESFRLTEEEEKFVNKISDIEKMLGFYYDQDMRYLGNLQANIYNEKFKK